MCALSRAVVPRSSAARHASPGADVLDEALTVLRRTAAATVLPDCRTVVRMPCHRGKPPLYCAIALVTFESRFSHAVVMLADRLYGETMPDVISS